MIFDWPVNPRPTAKSSATTAPWPTNGPTPARSAQKPNAATPCQAGSTATTITANTPHSAAARQPAASPTCQDRTASCTGRLEQHFHRAGAARVLQRQHGLAPTLEREAVRDHRRQVEAACDEVEVMLHGVLRDACYLLDAEPVRADDAQLLEVQRRPLEALRRLDA